MNNKFLGLFFLAAMITNNAFTMIEQSPAVIPSASITGTISLAQSPAIEQPTIIAPLQTQPILADQLPVGTVIALSLKRLRGAPRYLTGSLNDKNPLVQLKAGMASGRDAYKFTVMENNNGMLALAVVSTGYGKGSMGMTSVRYLGIEAGNARLVTLPGAPQYFELIGSSLGEVRLKCATNGGFVTYQNGLGVVALAASEIGAYPFAILIQSIPQTTLTQSSSVPQQLQQPSIGLNLQQISRPIQQQSNVRGQGRR